jgi:hypothetical protein
MFGLIECWLDLVVIVNTWMILLNMMNVFLNMVNDFVNHVEWLC